MNDSATQRAIEIIQNAQGEGATGLDLHALGLKQLPPLPGGLKQLREVLLSRNRLTALPPEIWEMSRLQRLDLGSNRLSEIPTAIQGLGDLTKLDVSENRLSELPRELEDCSRLSVLYAYSNRLTEVDFATTSLTQLARLDLSANQLQRFTLSPEALPQLEELNLSNNQLESLPAGFEALQNLAILNLSGNRLTSVEALLKLPRLEELYLDDNQLATIPAELAGLASLRFLSAEGNPFGELPEVFHRVTNPGLQVKAEAAVKKLTTGGAQSGERYFMSEPEVLNFLLGIGGVSAVVKVVDLFYQRFVGSVSVDMKFPDGSSVHLNNLSRKAANEIVQEHEKSLASGKALFNLQNERGADLVVQAISRVPMAELIPKSGSANQTIILQNPIFQINPTNEQIMGDKIDIHDVSGSVINVKSRLQNVKQTINGAKSVDDDTKAKLDKLLTQLGENLGKLPPEKADDAEAVSMAAKELVDKATAEKPNKKSVQISAKGLKEAAEGLAGVVPIALEIVSTIAAFMGL